ncbi:B12-binding domain-containing radical SAM protein [Chitinophagaceae bacterium LB-8]|uniref:B12-binding domain-containing radical SAM protein n=1 Tax=Paraflavisolibacter caeni TaxID=2982496 RepID=A0A9X3BFJ4_9BACT|nr:radical SAM protein [Paraflavisolibacter caeni]MCU7548979.1 B12-binding domain-containing radical SAM protein [Paraflavisolibacter caeni]
MRPYVPLGILYISAYLEQHDYPNAVFDSTFSSFDKLCDELLQTKPDVVGIYTNLMTKLNVLRIIQFIKNQPELNHTSIVLGGPEVRNHIHNFLENGADYLVLGEGEQTMLELVKWLDGESSAVLSSIDGIAYKDKNQLVQQNNERSKLKNLDELPLPNRKKVNLQNYFDVWKSKHGTSAISINTMRGCPYSCKWCSRAVYGQSYRRRSAVRVADEIQSIKENYQVDSIWFVDDVFTISHKWMHEFTEEVIRRNLVTPYECITRADRLNEEVLKDLKRSGCFRVWIGAESGSQKIIDLMDRRVEVQQVRNMIRLAKKFGLQAGTFIMVGYPGETKIDIWETVNHLKLSDPDLFTITIAYPIKGTPLYAEVEERFIKSLPWEKSTDRDIDFKRTYKRKYYDYAVKMINNEVSFHKAWNSAEHNWRELIRFKLKSMWAKGRMLMLEK